MAAMASSWRVVGAGPLCDERVVSVDAGHHVDRDAGGHHQRHAGVPTAVERAAAGCLTPSPVARVMPGITAHSDVAV